ncbi:hypothetical protein N9F22_00060 [Alphaproteobacteria bacterium]|nr:hypothetical protein [Alphaproteobacteria bacterium]
MQKIKELLEGIFGAVAGVVGILFMLSYSIGVIYWLWISIQVGSFWMFLLGIAGPTVVVTGPIGAYSLIFGTPNWVFNTFG